jgi:hypothetical protein
MEDRRSTPSQIGCGPRTLPNRQIGWSPSRFLNAARVGLSRKSEVAERDFFNEIAPKVTLAALLDHLIARERGAIAVS